MKQLYIILMGFLLLASAAIAQNISYKETTFKRQGKDIKVYTNADLTNLDLKGNQMLLLTPMIVSNDGEHQDVMTPVVICGSNRYKALRREIALRNAEPQLASALVVRYSKKEQTPIVIDQATPYQSWMENGRVVMREQIIGCAGCGKTDDNRDLISFRDPANAPYTMSYVTPSEEGVKVRRAQLDAYINFVIDNDDIRPNYRNNEVELAKIDDFINAYCNNGHKLKIDQMAVTGYASPEATEDHNLDLSTRRAKSVAEHLKTKYGSILPTLKVEGMGEDWARLRKLVAESDMPRKQQLLDIIDDDKYANLDLKEKALSRHADYAHIAKLFYPMCRRNDVSVDFTAPAFTLEEARQIIESQPDLLSEAEMYRVAQSYPADSPERLRAFSAANKFFPTSTTAAINLAIRYIEDNQALAAATLLEPMAEKPGVNGILGVAYARAGQSGKAEQALRKAASEGDANAQKNLQLLLDY